MSSILFYLNGQRVVVDTPDLDMTLLRYLRQTGLTGTKLGCGEGGCGACTVMVSRYDTLTSQITHASVNACLCPLATIDGKHVITVEGLGTSARPHPVQERIALLHGSQCGFCTPGFVMSLYTLLRNKPNPTEHEIEECFDGNLCRCTGYRPILDAAKTFADVAWKQGTSVLADGTVHVAEAKNNSGGCGIEECCQLKEKKERANTGCCKAKDSSDSGCCKLERADSGMAECVNQAEVDKAAVIAKFQRYDPTQDLIFPPFLIRYAKQTTNPDEPHLCSLDIVSSDPQSWCKRYLRPLTLTGLLEALDQNPDAKLVAGNTKVGTEIKLNWSKFQTQIYINDIPELRQIKETTEGIEFGGNLTLAALEQVLDEFGTKYGVKKTQSLAALRNNLRYFAGNQIRNVATITGSIAVASPISDLNPTLLAAGARLTLASANEQRVVPISKFFLGYQRTAIQRNEVLVSVFVPFTSEFEVVRAFKQAKRKNNTIAIVTCGLRIKVDSDQRITDAAFAYGGVAPTTVLAKEAAHAALGGKWGDKSVLDSVLAACVQELQLDYAVPGGMAEYRMTLVASFLLKFWATSCEQLGVSCSESVDHDDDLVVSKARQEYARIEDRAIVGRGVAHLAALKQATGEARYVDDMPALQGELHVGLVMSPHAHARILSIDGSLALALPGVVHVLAAKDVPGENHWNVFKDEEILPSDIVHYYGQPVALVIASSQKLAQDAAQHVIVQYEPLPAILSIRDAMAQQSFFAETRQLVNGDVDAALQSADLVLEGSSYCGTQEHFYLETMGAVAVPKGEDGEMEVFASTQIPTEVQMTIAEVLGLPASHIVCRVKRLGGSFGGKETRSILIAAFAALGAHHSDRSVRISLDRNEDMQVSGQRHPFFGTWTVGVTHEGKILALRARVYLNGGFSHDLSIGVVEHGLAHIDNCYRIPATDFAGRVCRTHTQANTAFRGFGACQGMFLTESMLCEVADRLRIPVETIRQLNLYQQGDVTPFSHQLNSDWNVPRMWDQLKAKAQYEERRLAVDKFNRQSTTRKRGLAMLPTKFGMSFGVKHLNQGMALVHVYMDGSVLVAHGGVEMGQGLHTKMAMVAAETLKLPLESIFISETATNTAANTTGSGGSVSSDLYGYAVHNACRELADRLQPYRDRMVGEPFAKIAMAAYLDRCNLTVTGHYCTPDIGYNWETNEGQLFFYFTQGVAIAEVELDTLTGSHTTLRVDIIMDIGRSLNKAIDIGQIEGAFTQGQGWSTSEEFLYSPTTGRLFTTGPGNYKIPTAMDIARDFRVELLEGADTSALKTIFSSKGVGEPPLFLGASVFFALRDAVGAKRRQEGVEAPLHMESPATPETLRMACEDQLAQMVKIPQALKDGKTPFVIRI
ncbi:hypothetical protein IWW38_000543 [Coemansia aciculifera]|uniref:Uncharacterized protein n=1 Tax=Coemansia aciculifera TaxID=417176 RepID=A0ACC1M9H0_9FUNG|nr:hypothetical protein IWW38_000543 [Coemansia aciculifera]